MVIEDSANMGSMVGELSNQVKGSAGRFILAESSMEYDISKRVDLIVDPFSLEVSSKDVISGLQKKVADHLLNGDNYILTNEALESIIEFILTKSLDVESSITMDGLSIQSVMKAASLKLMEPDNICQKLCDYTTMVSKYAGKMLSVMVNMDCFVSDTDYDDCVRNLRYLNIPILFIESECKADSIPTKILDVDFCELNF